MTPEAPEPLTCTLRLLFDGKTPEEVAYAIHDAMGANIEAVWWKISDQLPYALMYIVDAGMVHGWLDGNDLKFTGTDIHMRNILKKLERGSVSDFANDAMYEACREVVMAEIDVAGLSEVVTPKVTEEGKQ